MNSSSLRSGHEVLLLAFRPKAIPPTIPADSYGIQRTGDGTAPKGSGWRPTAALVARASIVHSTGSGFWPRPGKPPATSELRKRTMELRAGGAIAAPPL